MTNYRRIIIDLSPVTSFYGVWRYGISLLRYLLESDWRHQYHWFITASDEQVQQLKWINCHDGIEVLTVPPRVGFFRDNIELKSTIAAVRPFFYWTPDYLGVGHNFCAQSVTVHDVFRITHPHLGYSDDDFIKTFGSDDFTRLCRIAEGGSIATSISSTFSAALAALQKDALARSRVVCTPSKTTSREVRALFPGVARDLRVLRAGCDLRWFAPVDIQGTERASISKPFILSVIGDARVHKGLKRLLAAYSLCGVASEGTELICVGRHDCEVPPGVRTLSSVSDAQLGVLYRECIGLVVASDAEGFCLPACEAVAHGKPVLAPENSAIREATCGLGLFYKPGDVVDLANKMTLLCSQPCITLDPVEFDWSRAGQEFRSILLAL